MSIFFVLALNFINGIAVQAARVVLALYALDIGARPATVGILAATFSIFPMLLAVAAGRLADRFGARWLLLFGAALGGVGVLLPFFVRGLPAIFMAAALVGLSSSIYGVSLQNLVGLLSEPPNRAQSFSNYSLTNSAANLMGPLIAGFSIDYAGHAFSCLYLVLFFLVPVTMLGLRRGALRGGPPRATHTSGGIRAMLAAPGVPRVLAIGSLQNAGDSLYQFYMPVYTHAIGLSASSIGIILAVYAAAAFVVRLMLARLVVRFTEERLLAYAFYLGAASMLLVPFFEGAFMLALVSFTFGFGMGCCGPIVTMLMFGNSPAGRSGEALGVKITTNHFTKVVSPIVFGFIGSALGLPAVFWISACVLSVGGYSSRAKKKG